MAITASTTIAQLKALEASLIKTLKALEGELLVKNPAPTLLSNLNAQFALLAKAIDDNGATSGTITTVETGETLTGVTPSGSYTNTVTFTVANGAITAIVLS